MLLVFPAYTVGISPRTIGRAVSGATAAAVVVVVVVVAVVIGARLVPFGHRLHHRGRVVVVAPVLAAVVVFHRLGGVVHLEAVVVGVEAARHRSGRHRLGVRVFHVLTVVLFGVFPAAAELVLVVELRRGGVAVHVLVVERVRRLVLFVLVLVEAAPAPAACENG